MYLIIIALLPGQYLGIALEGGIAQEGGIQSLLDPHFDLLIVLQQNFQYNIAIKQSLQLLLIVISELN